MRKFTDIANDQGLEVWIEKPSSTLHFRPDAYESHVLPIIVRRFNGEWPPALTVPFADLVQAAQRWIEQHPDLAALVSVEQPVEIGQDFVARKHYRYCISTDEYDDWNENAPEPPPELEEMRATFRKACSRLATKRDELIAAVLAHSILDPNGKTFFNEQEKRFVIVEPRPTIDKIRCWAELRCCADQN